MLSESLVSWGLGSIPLGRRCDASEKSFVLLVQIIHYEAHALRLPVGAHGLVFSQASLVLGYEDKVGEVLKRVLMECGLCVLVGLLVVDVEDLLELVSLLLERL